MSINPNIEPMSCKLGLDIDLEKSIGWVFQEKLDGHRAIMHSINGKNYFYSRRTSVVTKEKEDNTDRLPYFHSMPFEFEDTILDGELVAEGETNSSIVQTILGSTPKRAKELWDSGHKLHYCVFDVLRFKGKDVTTLPLLERIKILSEIQDVTKVDYLHFLPFYTHYNTVNYSLLCTISQSYKEAFNELVSNGSEGIILKDLNSPYEFKRTSTWLKFKEVKTVDLVILGFVKPKKDYTGKFSKDELKERGWEYWENGEPVSKTYAKGWVAGIRLGAYKDGKLKYVTTVKGFSDEVQEIIRHEDLSNVVVEIECQGIVNPLTKSLRHPRFKFFRYEKDIEDCLWENI